MIPTTEELQGVLELTNHQRPSKSIAVNLVYAVTELKAQNKRITLENDRLVLNESVLMKVLDVLRRQLDAHKKDTPHVGISSLRTGPIGVPGESLAPPIQSLDELVLGHERTSPEKPRSVKRKRPGKSGDD